MLPVLRGRPVTVAPSVSVWLAAQQRVSTVEGVPLLAAGPDLAHVDREFDEISAVYPGSVDLRGEHAGVAQTLRSCAGRRSRTWPATATTSRRTCCSPGSTWPTVR